MKKDLTRILSYCLLAAVIFYVSFLQYNLSEKLEKLENQLLNIEDRLGKVEREQKIHSFSKEKVGDFWEDDNFKEFQKSIIEYVNKNISKLVSEKPAMGGKWVVSNIEFFSPEVIKVVYEDGHEQGVMFFKIENAYNSKIEIKPYY